MTPAEVIEQLRYEIEQLTASKMRMLAMIERLKDSDGPFATLDLEQYEGAKNG